MDQENSRNGVKRNLFGTAPSDHTKSQESLMREANRISKEKSEIWNFDFEKFQPLPPGRYKWERVGKRLQTRTSPTPAEQSTSESITIEEIATKRHYNLRTREPRQLRPIEPEGCSNLHEGVCDRASSLAKDTKKKRKHKRIIQKQELVVKLNM